MADHKAYIFKKKDNTKAGVSSVLEKTSTCTLTFEIDFGFEI